MFLSPIGLKTSSSLRTYKYFLLTAFKSDSTCSNFFPPSTAMPTFEKAAAGCSFWN